MGCAQGTAYQLGVQNSHVNKPLLFLWVEIVYTHRENTELKSEFPKLTHSLATYKFTCFFCKCSYGPTEIGNTLQVAVQKR